MPILYNLHASRIPVPCFVSVFGNGVMSFYDEFEPMFTALSSNQS